jgi:hypothetical protein
MTVRVSTDSELLGGATFERPINEICYGGSPFTGPNIPDEVRFPPASLASAAASSAAPSACAVSRSASATRVPARADPQLRTRDYH